MVDESDFLPPRLQRQRQKEERVPAVQRRNKQEAIQEYGSFEKEDRVKKILSARIINKDKRKIQFQVSWKKRKNNMQPLDSLVKNEEMLMHEQDTLINYYEQHLTFTS